jgi:hypothetical protein
MSKDEALRLALKTLEYAGPSWIEARQPAITAIKEALAQTEPNYKKALEAWLDKTEWVQETVKPHELGMHRADVLKQRIEEASPQRTWVGLTEDEIEYAFKTNSVMVDNGNAYMVAGLRAVNIARAIEAAHGIKGQA